MPCKYIGKCPAEVSQFTYQKACVEEQYSSYCPITLKVLNLYAGIGGNRKLWDDVDVTAVEIDPQIAEIYQDFFPCDEVVVGDAHQFLHENYQNYDFIWSSPPCPTHSRSRFWSSKGGDGKLSYRLSKKDGYL